MVDMAINRDISEVCKLVSGHVKKAKVEDLRKQMPHIPDSFKKFHQDIIDKFVDNAVCLCESEIEADGEPTCTDTKAVAF